MRYIRFNPADIELPEGWSDAIAALEDKIRGEEDPAKRAKLIDDNSKHWKSVKSELSKLFNNKCWYTESTQEGTDTDVDHFRPKKRVAEVKDEKNPHPGYWWLAFKLDNYRFSCIYANRRRKDVETGETGGKADHFPLWKESSRAWCPDDDCDEEQPLLLDPCKASDVALIAFKEDGEAMARFGEEKRPKAHKRAEISIELYNLNHTDFVKARISLRDQISKLVADAARYYKKLESGDATHEHAYERAIEQLIEYVDMSAPYSGFCVAYLENYRHEEYLHGVL
ncbi:MAG: hypothetical protein RPU64_16585 [Candidatus Sedimenticola sp. (ex Thyasira tokunagai)]